MKQITTFLKELRTILDDNNYSNAVVVDLGFTLTEFDVLAVEASFAVRHPNGKTDVLICNSNIDIVYLDQYSDEHLIKQVIGDLLFDLEVKFKEVSAIH
tara:strand:- start:6970 stop:7266 length:297 start_codon:yes stop_codon:yes gene_type:complete